MIAPMILPRFDFEAPGDVGQALALLAGTRGEARLLAGGTDLLVKMKRGQVLPRLLISLAGVEELSRLQEVEDPDAGPALSVGPLCTMATLAAEPRLAGWARGLADGAAVVGGPIIRNRATVGGNIVTARPCADSVAPLMALGARLQICGPEWERVVALDGFISGPGRVDLRPDELVRAVRVPVPTRRAGSSYLKITRRAAMEVTVAGCAAGLELDARGRVARARLVYTSVGATPLRVPAAEQALQGERPDDEEALSEAAHQARRGVTPIDDHRGTAAYRREVVGTLTRRAVAAAQAAAAQEVAS